MVVVRRSLFATTVLFVILNIAVAVPESNIESFGSLNPDESTPPVVDSNTETAIRSQEAAALAEVDKEETAALDALQKVANHLEPLVQTDDPAVAAPKGESSRDLGVSASSINIEAKPSLKAARGRAMFPSEYLQRVHDGCNNCEGNEFQCCCCAEGSPQGNDCVCCECPEAIEGADGDATHWLHIGDGRCEGTARCSYNPSYSTEDNEFQGGLKPAFATWQTPTFKKTEVSLNQCQELCRMFDDCLGVSFKAADNVEATDCILHYKYPSGAEDGTLQQTAGTLAQLGANYICDKGPGGDTPPAATIGGADGENGYVCKGKPTAL